MNTPEPLHYVAAVDIGASSGRVMLAAYNAAEPSLKLEEIHRFDNGLVRRDGYDCWDLEHLHREICRGLERIEAQGIALESVGIDTWGVDFVLLDRDGQVLGQPVAYRDHRTDGMMPLVHAKVSRAEIYSRTGIQFLQFNTIYQLQALLQSRPPWLRQVDKLLLIPDYLHYRLCGVRSCEYTNATTTQLLNVRTGMWDEHLLQAIGVPHHWFLSPTQPSALLGHWTNSAGRQVKVIAPATHDTGAAVVAAPLEDQHTAYISSGTWSLMGLESRTPFTGLDALGCNITNEGGVEDTFRVLKNIMGLWLIQRVRSELGEISFAELAEAARVEPAGAFLIDPNDPVFLNPPSMIDAIREFCRHSGQGAPASAGQLARCVFDSLALLYRQTLRELELVSGMPIRLIRIVGGGANNALLNQLTADFCQLPVATGPIEASALGNACCQLKGLGLLADLHEIRRLTGGDAANACYEPQVDAVMVENLWQRFRAIGRGDILSPLSMTEETA